MRILLWHGYLLRGSGSNIYASNIARAWRRQGHDVLVLCQESDVSGLDFVDEIGTFDDTNSSFSTEATGISPGPGRCRVVAPFIDGLLPVYVYDDYPGFVVKTFVDLEESELEHYNELNVKALSTALDMFEPEAFITGHEVMGPYIAREATTGSKIGYVAKLHGSALEYAVKKQERYRGFAVEGLGGARLVVGGSEYIVREAARHIEGWAERAVIVNPGCDTGLFRPRETVNDEPTVGYVGKLIAAKGVHHLLGALPLIDVPDLRGVIVGYGGFESELKALASGLRVDFSGRLEHGPLAEVLPTFDVLAVPSVVPEAFGMVAAEAAACGVLPVVPDHSGIGEVGRILERELGCEGLLVFDHTNPVPSLAQHLEAVLRLSSDARRDLGLGAAALARKRWSWPHIADRLRQLASS